MPVPIQRRADPGNVRRRNSGTSAELREGFAIESRDILNLDSSNIQPEEWQFMAEQVAEALPDYDGIIITHGTDTMAYTASALSYMLQN